MKCCTNLMKCSSYLFIFFRIECSHSTLEDVRCGYGLSFKGPYCHASHFERVGSELAKGEKTVFFYFKTWLKSVFRGAETISVMTDLYMDSIEAVTVKMADVLQFFTDASSLPPCGFRSKISIFTLTPMQ